MSDDVSVYAGFYAYTVHIDRPSFSSKTFVEIYWATNEYVG